MSERNDILDPDLNRLEWELHRQPGLMDEWSCKLADARKALDEARNFLDITQAEVSNKIRKDPESFGLDKVTETAISNALIIDSDVMQAKQDWIDARHEFDTIQSMVNALEHKKSSLRELVALHGQDYFSKPYIDDKGAESLKSETRTRVRTKISSKEKARPRKTNK